VVVDVGSESATVAVTAAEANKVAYAVAHGSVSLAVTAGPPGARDSATPDPAAPDSATPDTAVAGPTRSR
jgi:hypothetical protein